ncbi:hypothetical protein GMOD_00004237 [Pyrenophora seminiperda CCB06]|uniref:Uncharacterized protein n=1 Tax=Pyrenophora seminiperda CCB06 TaxID=1302712 RepID=A0A3M7M0T3_9PLEO|nr:hypothetical protein GMOD_00004237 [Pyrenophora seminiperda CCB06]
MRMQRQMQMQMQMDMMQEQYIRSMEYQHALMMQVHQMHMMEEYMHMNMASSAAGVLLPDPRVNFAPAWIPHVAMASQSFPVHIPYGNMGDPRFIAHSGFYIEFDPVKYYDDASSEFSRYWHDTESNSAFMQVACESNRAGEVVGGGFVIGEEVDTEEIEDEDTEIENKDEVIDDKEAEKE